MRTRLVRSVAALFLVLVGGTIGYMIVEGWSVFDAMYMTVITVATVGFAEVQPLDIGGRVLTVVLILAGVTALGISFGTFVDFLVEGHLRGILEGRRMEKRIAGLSAHHVVAGIGRVGSEVVRALAREGAPFVVVDQCEDCAAEAQRYGWLYMLGDATDERTLVAAGVERASSLVATVDTDADNLFITLTARTLNPDLFIVARSSSVSSEDKLRKAGADRVITPNVIGGTRMATMVLHPVVSDYLDLIMQGDGIQFRLEEVEVGAGSPLAGASIAESRVRDVTGALVLAIRGSEDDLVNSNPSSGTVMQAGDRLVVLGTAEQLGSLDRMARAG